MEIVQITTQTHLIQRYLFVCMACKILLVYKLVNMLVFAVFILFKVVLANTSNCYLNNLIRNRRIYYMADVDFASIGHD